jgi:hypothetical protein
MFAPEQVFWRISALPGKETDSMDTTLIVRVVAAALAVVAAGIIVYRRKKTA